MGYVITGLPDYWTGLPTAANPPPPFEGVTSYINWTNWSGGTPTYGNFGGGGYPATPEGMLLNPVNSLDGYFKMHDIGYSSLDPAARHAADLELVKNIKDNYSNLIGTLHPADMVYADTALKIFEQKIYNYEHPPKYPYPNPLTVFLKDPLVLDLDGNGITLSSLSDSNIHFDYAGDGFAEKTGWVSADDGLLALDANGNGQIDNGLELFGSSTQDGFAVLETLDSNRDGKISSLDSRYSELLVWNDLNQNGVSESGELRSLAEVGVASISLSRANVNGTNSGHTIGYEGTFTRTDATTGVAQTVYFQTDQQNTVNDSTPDFTPLAEVSLLPQLNGSGTIHSVAYRATNDTAFRAVWTALSDSAANLTPSELRDTFEAALLEWAETSSIDPISRGPYVDARHLAFVEAFFGETYREVQFGAELRSYPGSPSAGAAVEASFYYILSALQLQFLSQTAGSTVMRGLAEASHVGDSPYLFFHLLVLGSPAPGAEPATTANVGAVLDALLRTPQPDQGTATSYLIKAFSALDGLVFLSFGGDRDAYKSTIQPFLNTVTDGVIRNIVSHIVDGTILSGTTAAEGLSGTEGADVLLGGGGGDLLIGGEGGDVYLYGKNDGNLWIKDTGSTTEIDRLVLTDLDSSDVTFDRIGDNLLLRVMSTGSSIVVEQFFSNWNSTSLGIDIIRFADGNEWGRQLIKESSVFRGDGHANEISDSWGDDVLRGGRGDDLIRISAGNDTIIYSKGDGSDTITDNSWATTERDTLVLSDLVQADVEVSRAGNALLLRVIATGDVVQMLDFFTIKQFWDVDKRNIDVIRFADGTAWDRDAIQERAWYRGTEQADFIQAGDLDDTIEAGKGDDFLQGAAGSDRYVWRIGDGNDQISDTFTQNGDIDTLELVGVSRSQVTFSYQGDTLLINVDSGEVITVPSFLAGVTSLLTGEGDAGHGIDVIKFADGEMDRLAIFRQAGEDYLGLHPQTYGQVTAGAYDWLYFVDEFNHGGNIFGHMFLGDDDIYWAPAYGGVGGWLGPVQFSAGGNNSLIGDVGNDTMAGGAKHDILEGNAGNDVLYGDYPDESVTLYGNDILTGGSGNDALYGGGGLDLLSGGQGNDYLAGGDGKDFLDGGTGDDVFFGGKGDDILYGNTANSTGNDTYLYRSGDGNDILFESASGDASIETDTLILSDISVAGTELSRVGDDLRILIKATGETVTVVGHFLNRGAGNDSAGQGIEVLKFADAEWDRAKIHQEAWIRGTDGRDVIVTDVANAHLSDTVEGGKGDDVIVSTAQSESGGDTFVYSSGDGNDVIQESTAGNGEIDTLRFKDLNAEDVQLSRSGTDLLVKVIATGEVINIVGQFFFDAVVSPAGIERIQFADGEVWGRVRIHDEAFFRGTEGRDFIETNSRMDDTIEGGKGDDVIYSGFQSASGNDTFVYSRGDGNDYIREETWRSFSSTDIDVLLLKDLNAADVQISRNGSDLRITILAMNETITVSGQFGETSDGPGMGLEFIRFANGDEWGRETIFGIVSSASPFLAGTKNNDTITGAAISQNIYGEAGDDILDGRGGNDLLYGGLGNDTLRISVSAPGDIVTATGGVGIDTVDLSGFSAAVAVDLVSSGAEVRTTGQPDLSLGVLRDVAQLEGVENVVGSAFSDTIAGDAGNNVLTAGDGDDTLDGRSGNDVLLGEAGDDLLFGGMGEDRLEGGDGNDTLNGNVGADVLSGGAGDDILTGGTEGDIFVLGANGGHDVIADFVAGDGEGHDVLRIDRTIIANMNAFFAAASQQGDDVVVSLGAGNSVTLSGVSLAALTSANVEFRRIDNFAPTAINVQGTTVAENAAAGTVIATLAAIDSSDAGPHTFELVSDASGFFEVVGDKLVVKAGALIDFEVASKHLVEIRAVDDDGLSVTTAVEVTVTDQVEQLTAAPGGSQLMAGIGNDILVSGAGNDVLAGGAGSDEYRYFTGGGDDRIIDAGGSGDIDRLVLGPTILPSNIVVARSSLGTSDVALRISDGTTIVLQDQLLQGQGAGIEEIRFADNTVWTRADILSHLHSDILFGTSGADALSGSMGAETFYAGAGADVLRGYAGSDTYRYSSAIGTDTIVEGNDEGVDRLQLEAFNKENVQLMRSGTDLIVLAGPAGNSITIKDQFLWGDAGIEEIIFGDGSVWSRAEISARAYQFGTNGADTLVGTGDDDVLRGGLGDDVMNGGAGSDTYLYLLGDGNDIIDDGVNAAPQTDVLRFEDLDASDVEVSRTGNDLTVKVISTGETIKVAKQFASPTEFWGIEQIGFADGVAWDRAAIAENAWIRGTSSGERFDGSANGEVFDGAGGNDTLVGGAGSDTYIYRVGSGDDVIYEDASPADIDTIKLIDLNASDIQLRRSGNDLFLKILSSGDELRVMSQFSNSSGVERVLFADGTSWDRAEIVSNTWYRGSAGDDRFDGSANGEVFDGAGGNDTLVGGAGSDTYIYRVGSGGDVIYEDPSPADIDTIKLIDLNASDIQLRRSGNDLLLKILSSGDELRVMSQFSNGSGIEKVLFADGTSWDRAAIADNAWYRGSAGDDRFDGSAGGEVFDGAGGNDTLVGGTGSDTYIYRVGSGGDVVYEYPSAADIDTIKLIDLGPSDIELRRLGNDLFLTILSSGEELRVIDQFSNGNGVEKVLFADGTSWDRTEIVSNTQYRGSSGDDSISASSDADILSGGLGNDYLRGNGGNDVYLYSSGDGVDEIDDQSGSTTDIDTLRFGSLNAADLTFARQGEALSIFVSSTGHTIKVDNQFYSQTANWGIEKVEFANGSSWDLATINANAWIRGTAGNDSISGSSWSDTFKGGLGDDHFASGAGSDRYIYASGDGNDYIDDESGSTSDVDIVQFVDLNAGDLTFSRIGGNLVATVNANGQTVTFDEQFYSQTANWGIEKIEFANGSSWDLATINANAWIRGTAGNDTISGSSWNDTFKGGLGDDRFSSGAGSDRYVYASGDGNDYIDDESGSTSDIDVLQLTDLNAGDLTFSRVGVHLVATVNANGQTITFDEQFYSQTANWGIEKIEFANGTSWDLATINANAWIRGTAGNDTISGTAWNDTIHGGAGNDALSGGAGDDLFVFRAGFGQDSISDFSVGHDKLEFGDGLFADAATAFAAASAQGSDTVITIDASTTVLLQNVALANLHVDDFRVV